MSLNDHKVDKKGFANRQALMRRIHNIKQKDLAEALEVTRSYVSGVEATSGKAMTITPGLAYVRAIRNYFGEQHNDLKPYDWWIEGIEITKMSPKVNENELTLLRKSLEDKEELLSFYKEKLARTENELAVLKAQKKT